MPFRNAAETLPEALASIEAQTLPDWELIAVDDRSDDGSASLFPRKRRIRVLSPGPVGLVEALNAGLSEARGPFVARMDADDVMLTSRLEEQAAFLDSHLDVTLVASRVRMIPEDSVRGGYREYLRWQDGCITPEEIDSNIYVEAPFVHPTVMFRRSTGLSYRSGAFPEDYELWLRMHETGLRMAKIPNVLLLWRHRPERATQTDERYSTAAFDRIRAEYLSRDPRLRGERAVVIWGAGRRTRQRLRHLLERLPPVAWIDIDPRKTGRQLNGTPVCQPEWLDRPDKPFVLCCVTSHGARELISARLDDLGYRLGTDYLPVGI